MDTIPDKSVSQASVATAAPWWTHTVFYEVYVDKFAGNFVNFTAKLDYLKRLGIDCVHLLPHYPSPMVDDGYDVSDYKSVRSELGTLADFSAFTNAAHGRGMKIMVDFVLNHTSTEHPWFKEASGSKDNPKRDFYLWSGNGQELTGAANPFAELKPDNWIRNAATNDFYFSTFYPAQADLNWDNPHVFDAMMEVMDFWVAQGADGFRLDAAAHLVKREGTDSKGLPETHALLKRIRAHLDLQPREIALLAEVSGTIENVKPYFGNGDECTLAYLFSLAVGSFLAIARGDRRIFERVAEASRGIPGNCAWATMLRHHDEMHFGSLSPDESDEVLNYFDPEAKYRFSGGASLRLATMFRSDKEKTLAAYRMLFDAPGSPIIYYGDEIGMENEPLTAGEKDTRKSVRGAFDWEKARVSLLDPDSLFNKLSAMIKNLKSGATRVASAAPVLAVSSSANAAPPSQ